MIRLSVFCAAIISICIYGPYASAAGGGHGTKPVNLSDSHLGELANRPGRVGGYWVNSNDWFYFAGDTKALNDFLRAYAELAETPHVLVVHPGKAPVERCVGELFAEPYDWKLDSMWPAFTREKKWFERPRGGRWQRAVVVQAWLGGNIQLDELNVPTNIEVREGGEIKEFIEWHNRQRVRRDAQRFAYRQDVILRGAAASCRDLCLDVDEDAKVEQIGGATSARCLRLAEGRLPRVRWKLTSGGPRFQRANVDPDTTATLETCLTLKSPEGTEHTYVIQAQSGRFAGWYLDFDDDAEIAEMGGATSSRNLLLTKGKVPGAYWKVTETDQGFLIQAQAGRFYDWYLDLDLLTKQEVEGAFWQIEGASADIPVSEETLWGRAVEGVQCRLLPEKSTWRAGQTPRLQADLRNRGTRELSIGLYPTSWTVEYDGVSYHATAEFSGGVELLRLNPGDQRDGISLLLEDRFQWMSEDGRHRLVSKPGRHTLRAAFRLQTEDGTELRIVSNLVEIEISERQAERDRESEPLVIDLIRAEGNMRETPSFWIGYEQLSEDALRQRAKQFVKASPKQQVVLRVDRAMPHEHVAELLELLNAVGAKDVSLSASPLDSVFAIDPGPGRDGTIRGKVIAPSNHRGRPVNYFVTLDNDAWAYHHGVRPSLEVAGGETFEFRNVPAGKYKVSAQPVTDSKQDAASVAKTTEVEVVVKNKQVVEIQLSFNQRQASAAWGEPVEGLQCRLRAEKTEWTTPELQQPGGAVRCKVVFRNRSDRTWSYLHPQAAEQHVEWDGRWHRMIRLIPAIMRPLPPGEVVRNVDCSVDADVIWAADDSPGPSKARPVVGWHTVRTAIHFSSGDRIVKVVSNPVKIRIVDASELAGTRRGQETEPSTDPPQDEPIEPPPVKDEPSANAPPVSEAKAPPTESPQLQRKKEGLKREFPWGEAVHGLQCRLHVAKATLELGQCPRLLVDVKNEGERELSLGEAPDFWELECDGTWYRASVWFSGDCKILELSPSNTSHAFPLLLAERWKWRAKDRDQPLALGPGKHLLRVALRPAPKQEGPRPRLVSNPVEIEVVDQAETGGENTSWGPATEGVQCRLRVEKLSWPQGTAPKLLVDLQNQGERDLSIAIEHESWEIKIDGKWHPPNGGMSGIRRSLPLAVGQTQRDVEVWDWLWENVKKTVQELPPGKHTLHVARTLPGFGVPNRMPLIRVVSNPIEVEVLPNRPTAD